MIAVPSLAAMVLAPMASVASAQGTNPQGAGQGQIVDDDALSVSAASLDLPKNITIFGNTDPNLRRATAIVNGTIITRTDVDQRLALVVAANGGNVPESEKERLRLQVLRNLIDETLQIQEAAANDIKISKGELDEAYARIAGNFRRSPEQFDAYLKQQNSSSGSIRRQIEGEMAWSRLLRRNVQPFVNVSEEEVQSVIKRLNEAKGTEEFHIGEIYLSATPDNAQQISQNAQNIIEQIKKGGSFQAYARQFSEASTAAVGGDLGWVRQGQVPDAIAQTAASLGVGQLTGPIQVPGGFSIILLIDKRQVLTADPRDAVLSLKQISISFPKGTTEKQAADKAAGFASMVKTIHGCGEAEKAAATIGASVVANDQIKARDLPGALQETLLKLSVGEATPPFGSIEDGVRVLLLCGRDDPKVDSGPSFDELQQQMEDDRVNKRAQTYLRDLRRDAVIEYN